MSDRTYAPDVESTDFARTGLPDDPNLEMEWADVRCQGCGVAILVRQGGEQLCMRCRRPEPPTGAALFPEIPTWSDDQLVIAIELADRREPALRLGDAYDLFLHECSAELVRRLEARGVGFAA